MRLRRRIGAGLWFALWLAAVVVGPVLAASPAPSDAIGGDPRSPGQGPGLVGDPITAVLIVVAIGLLAVGLTLVYVRLPGGRRP